MSFGVSDWNLFFEGKGLASFSVQYCGFEIFYWHYQDVQQFPNIIRLILPQKLTFGKFLRFYNEVPPYQALNHKAPQAFEEDYQSCLIQK